MFNYYIAHIGITNCLADIRLNDVPLFIGGDKGYQSFSIPLNPCIDHNGLQMLTATMMPPTWRIEKDSDGEGSIWVEVALFDAHNGQIERQDTIVRSKLVHDGKSMLTSFKIDNKPFEAYIDNPVSRWNECMRLDDGRNLMPVVLTFYNRLGKILKNKQYDIYSSLISTREKDLVKALGLDEKEIVFRQQMLEDTLSDGFELVELSGDEKIHFYAGGRVLSLLTIEYKPALRFFNKETEDFMGLDLLLGIKQGSHQLTII